jgi:AcrR family transcriptional regulator
MDEIAAQLGISKKTIYQFYADKDEIVEAIVTREIDSNESKCMDCRKSAENAIHEVFLGIEQTEEMLKGMNPLIMYDLEKHHPRAFKKLRDHKLQFLYKTFRENLVRGIDEELYRPEVNVEIVAKLHNESVFLFFNQEIFPQNRFRVIDIIYEIDQLYLHGIITSKGRKYMEKYMQKHVLKNDGGLYLS